MNITGKYLKVWKVEEKNGYTKLDLGDSNKKQDGTYENWTWFGCTLMGKAKDVQVKEGDVLEVKSGIISKRKYNDKYYDDIRIFEVEVMESKQSDQGFVSVDDTFSADDDCPF